MSNIPKMGQLPTPVFKYQIMTIGGVPPHICCTHRSPQVSPTRDLCSQAFLATAGQEHLPGKPQMAKKKGPWGNFTIFFLKNKSTCVSFYVISVDC